jgi:hypothetical protein
MSEDGGGGLPLGKPLERLGGLMELLTTLDQRILGALNSLDAMDQRIAGFDDLGMDGRELIADVKQRVGALDERLNRDLDDVKAAIMAKIGELELGELGPRLDRLEQALLNVEKATINLDRAFEGSIEALPGFMSRRVKSEKRSGAPDPVEGETGSPA